MAIRAQRPTIGFTAKDVSGLGHRAAESSPMAIGAAVGLLAGPRVVEMTGMPELIAMAATASSASPRCWSAGGSYEEGGRPKGSAQTAIRARTAAPSTTAEVFHRHLHRRGQPSPGFHRRLPEAVRAASSPAPLTLPGKNLPQPRGARRVRRPLTVWFRRQPEPRPDDRGVTVTGAGASAGTSWCRSAAVTLPGRGVDAQQLLRLGGPAAAGFPG